MGKRNVNIFHLFVSFADYTLKRKEKSGRLYRMIPGSKGLNPHEPAQMWVNVLETRQNMSLKV
ncbi:MAG: hypothetical protein ACI4V0_00755, partial [Lachnospiraceae bacterium]